MDRITHYADASARAVMALICILSGVGKIGAYEATQGHMRTLGAPSFLLVPTILFEVVAGIAVLLASFAIVSAIIFHADFDDQIPQIMFLIKIATAGRFLLLAKVGGPRFSVDQLPAARKGVHS